MNASEQRAALSGTREMIREDEFGALVAALVDCNAIPKNVMAITLSRLADGMIAKARGELETEWAIYPAELFDRAQKLDRLAARIRGAGAAAGR